MINRDEFEDWLETHKDEAVSRIEAETLPLKRWITLLCQGLLVEMHEDGEVDDDDDDDAADGLRFGLDE